jgi:zinc D-Ala-D-Ala carboxypeptidase
MNIAHFTMAEFIASDTAARRGIDNTMPEDLEHNAWGTLALLETIRAHLSKVAGRDIPITIVSGYRCPALNVAVGGVGPSDHVKAMAADIRAPAFGTPYEIACELAPRVSVLGIGQLINEFADSPNAWVHVSTRLPDKAINRIITIGRHGTEVGVQK